MKKYVKEFFRRGLMFGGFGPIVAGIIYFILEKTVPDFSLSGAQVLIATVSIYLLAFLQAGASVFNQIESFSVMKSTFCHFSVLYVAYTLCYVVNDWIPFNINVLLIFTGVFAVVYLTVWVTVVAILKLTSKKLNAKLK